MHARSHALPRQVAVGRPRGGLALAGRRVLLVVGGRDPWPGAGGWGHAAMLVMALVALSLIGSQIPSGGLGPPNGRFLGNDLVAYLTGGALLAGGDAVHLYDAARQLEVQRALVAGLGPPDWGLNSYVNPPAWALLMAPLSGLGLLAADWLWRVVQLGLAGGALLAVAASVPGVRTGGWRRAALLALAFFPFVQGWHHRSMVSVLLVAYGGWMVLAAGGRPRLAGGTLSLLLLKPQYAVFPLVYLLWKRQWAQVAGFSLGAVVQAALAGFVFALAGGPPELSALAPFVADGADSGAFLQAQVSLRAALLIALPEVPAVARTAVLALVTGAAFVVLLRSLGRTWPSAPRHLAWEMLAVAAATGVTAVHNHVTGLVLLLPPAVALLAAGATPPRVAEAGGRPAVRGGKPFAPGVTPHRVAVRRPLAILALLLALPSVGILLAGVSIWLYVVAAWITTLGALGLALSVLRSGSGLADKPPAPRADAGCTGGTQEVVRAAVQP